MNSKLFGGVLRGMAFALAMVGSSISFAAEQTVDRLALCLASNFGQDYPSSVQKFEAELAYVASQSPVLFAGLRSDLIREGQGYRQASALDEGVGVGAGSPEPAWA